MIRRYGGKLQILFKPQKEYQASPQTPLFRNKYTGGSNILLRSKEYNTPLIPPIRKGKRQEFLDLHCQVESLLDMHSQA